MSERYSYDQVAMAAAFRFLSHPNTPNTPRPVAIRGSEPGSGVTVGATDPAVTKAEEEFPNVLFMNGPPLLKRVASCHFFLDKASLFRLYGLISSQGRLSGRHAVKTRARRGARGRLANRTRAALDPRSTGTRTGLHGACLTAASLRRSGQNPASQSRGKPGSGAEPSG